MRESIAIVLYLLSAFWALFAAAVVIARENRASRGRCRSCNHSTSVNAGDGTRRCAECGEPWSEQSTNWRRNPAVVYAMHGLLPGAALLIAAFLMYPVMTALLPRSVVASVARAEWELGQRDGPWMRVAAVRTTQSASMDGFHTLALRIVQGNLDRTFSFPEQVLLSTLLTDPKTPHSAVKKLLNASVKIVISPVSSPSNGAAVFALDRTVSYVWTPLMQSFLSSDVDLQLYSGIYRFDVDRFRIALYDFYSNQSLPIREKVHFKDIDSLLERIKKSPEEDDGRSGVYVAYRVDVPILNGRVASWQAKARVPLARLKLGRAGFEWPFDFEYDALGIKPRANTGEDVELKP